MKTVGTRDDAVTRHGSDAVSARERWRGQAKATLRHDLPASLTVFLVAVPLSLGIALASGAPLTSGLIAAAVGGIVVGSLGGSSLQVSGPAAGLTVTMAGVIGTFGWKAAGAIIAAAGVVQIALGASRVARAALTVSPSVVHGMLAGIGITIVLAQLHVVLGDDPQVSAFRNLAALPGEIVQRPSADVTVGLATMAVLLAWPRLPGGLGRVPAPLPAVLAGTVLAAVTGWNVVKPDIPADILSAVALPELPHGGVAAIAVAVLTVALVASLESLLSAVAVDKLHDGAKRANLDRELVGQGAANVCSGLLGGLAVTGVIVRSSANVAAGARTRASAILHGVWVVLFVVFLGGLVELIPLASLAALLVFVGARLLDLAHIRHLRRHRELPTYMVTMVGVLALGLLEGVLAGIAVALALALHRQSQIDVHVEHDDDHFDVTVEGSLTFLSVPKLTAALSQVPEGADVSLHLSVDYLDHAAFEAIHSWVTSHNRRGGTIEIHELHDEWYVGALAGEPIAVRKPTRPAPHPLIPWSYGRSLAEPAMALDSSSAAVRGRRRGKQGAPESPGGPEETLRTGVGEYKRLYAPLIAPFLREQVQHGQRPSQLFITCSDSRIVPSLITGSGPGDLFTVRNVGNLVPPYPRATNGDHAPAPPADTSVGAAIEYAIDVLGVRAVTVCGHSDCGAMKAIVAAQNNRDAIPGTLLNEWLTSGDLADICDLATAEHPADDGSAHDRLSEGNVVRQLHNLMTYPSVRTAVDDGRVHLIGMHFDTTTGNVRFLEDIAPGGVTADRELPDGCRFVRRSPGAQPSQTAEQT
jgi:carbonic anhydrase